MIAILFASFYISNIIFQAGSLPYGVIQAQWSNRPLAIAIPELGCFSEYELIDTITLQGFKYDLLAESYWEYNRCIYVRTSVKGISANHQFVDPASPDFDMHKLKMKLIDPDKKRIGIYVGDNEIESFYICADGSCIRIGTDKNTSVSAGGTGNANVDSKQK